MQQALSYLQQIHVNLASLDVKNVRHFLNAINVYQIIYLILIFATLAIFNVQIACMLQIYVWLASVGFITLLPLVNACLVHIIVCNALAQAIAPHVLLHTI